MLNKVTVRLLRQLYQMQLNENRRKVLFEIAPDKQSFQNCTHRRISSDFDYFAKPLERCVKVLNGNQLNLNLLKVNCGYCHRNRV